MRGHNFPFPLMTLLSRRCIRLSSTAAFGRRAVNDAFADASEPTFARVGLSRPLASALQKAFPNVQYPTQIQQQLIPAVSKGRDILLKDATGTGKSFGLMLSVLNLPPSVAQKGAAINTLIITPHRELANQLLHWIKRMYAGASHTGDVSPFAQALLRGEALSVAEQVQRIREQTPRILIATPQAALEALQAPNTALPLQHLSAVVVEEADYLIEYWTGGQKGKYDLQKFQRQLRSHPSATRQVLDFIYPKPLDTVPQPSHRWTYKPKPLENATAEPPHRRPQLIMASATLKSAFRNAVKASGLWFATAENRVLVLSPVKSEGDEPTVDAIYGGSKLVHSALVVSEDGSITNIPGALDPPATSDDAEPDAQNEPTTAEEQPVESLLPPSPTLLSTEGSEAEARAPDDSPFNPAALEAIAATFALDVPRVALLVLANGAPVRRAVADLQALGVQAHGLDVIAAGGGRSFLLGEGAEPVENPTLLVATLATIRGLDLPDLSHVFILGIPSSLTPDEYLHVAGRVGRFGRTGKVITIVEKAHVVPIVSRKGKPATGVKDEPRWLNNIYKKVKARPVKTTIFD